MIPLEPYVLHEEIKSKNECESLSRDLADDGLIEKKQDGPVYWGSP